MNAELQQNVFYTIYFTLAHNYLAIAYLIGVILSIALALYKPTRAAVLAIVGFGLLLFAFEYNKHIVDALKEQTTNALITEQPHYKVARLLHLSFDRLLPLFFTVGGWLSLITSAVLYIKSRSHTHE